MASNPRMSQEPAALETSSSKILPKAVKMCGHSFTLVLSLNTFLSRDDSVLFHFHKQTGVQGHKPSVKIRTRHKWPVTRLPAFLKRAFRYLGATLLPNLGFGRLYRSEELVSTADECSYPTFLHTELSGNVHSFGGDFSPQVVDSIPFIADFRANISDIFLQLSLP